MIGSSILAVQPTDRAASRLVGRVVEAFGEGFGHGMTRRVYLFTIGSLAFLFPFGLVFNLTGVIVDVYPWTSSVYIALIALATVLSEIRARPARNVLKEFAVLAAALWAVEWIGVTTGIPFGDYYYTEVLGFLVGGVPLAIPCAWYATVMNSRRLAERLVLPKNGRSIGIVLVAGILTFALDLVLEPMAAMIKSYWRWSAWTVPVQNYVSWVVFTMISVLLLRWADDTRHAVRTGLTVNAAALYGLQWVLFVVTGAGHGHVGPAVASAALLVVLLFVRRAKA